MATKEGKNSMIAYGTFVSEPTFDYTVHGRNFYRTELSMIRPSGIIDTIRVIISEDQIDHNKCYADGTLIKATGSFRSRNYTGEDGKNHIDLYLFVTHMEFVDTIPEDTLSNQIYIKGYICKSPVYRATPSGKHISDVIIAVPRLDYRSDYIPCIFWNKQAYIAKSVEVGEGLTLVGRVQSREYTNQKGEKGIAYEVSVSRVVNIIPKTDLAKKQVETIDVTDNE